MAETVFELLHMDLWGPYKSPTYSGAHYFVTVVDDFSRATWTHLIQSKDQELHKAFTIKDLGLVRYFLGLEVSRTARENKPKGMKDVDWNLLDKQALAVICLTLSRNVAFNIAKEKTTADDRRCISS
ncbi:hypothetical protein V2J09_001748 [Rumex salicifolius]